MIPRPDGKIREPSALDSPASMARRLHFARERFIDMDAADSAKTVLVVDDDLDAREALGRFLEIHGYQVECAKDGKDALERIENRPTPPALIFLDLMMPVMDGKTFLSRARLNTRLSNVPIVVTSANPNPDAAGATATLWKPLRPERILSLVRHFVDESSHLVDCGAGTCSPSPA